MNYELYVVEWLHPADADEEDNWQFWYAGTKTMANLAATQRSVGKTRVRKFVPDLSFNAV